MCLGFWHPHSPEHLDPIRRFLTAVPSTGGVPAPSTGLRLPPLDAIFWLGALAHTLDYDDVAGYSHPSAPAISAALPVAHGLGGVDGRTLLTAVALGQDLVIRLAQALHRPMSAHGWLFPVSSARR